MLKFIHTIFILILLNSQSLAEKINFDEFVVNKYLKTKLSSGEWYLAVKERDSYYGLWFDAYTLAKIENELVNSELIDQAVVYGDNKPFLVALLVLNNEKNAIEDKEIQNEIEKINKNFSKIEKIKKFFTIKEKFSIENGMLTPTMKLKRYKIIEKYKNNFEKLY